MAFLQNKSYECFKAVTNNNYEDCKKSSKDGLNRYLDEYYAKIGGGK
jgi:hypothetical protein